MTTVKDVLNVVLQDNASGMGGVSFDGETVGDMYEEADLSLSDSVDMLNDLLKDLGIKPIQNEKGIIKMKNTHSHINTDTEKVHVNAITSNLNTARVLIELQESEFNNIIENTDMGEEEATKASEQYAGDMVQDVEELLESYGYHYFNDMCGVDLLTKLQEYKTKGGN